MNIQSRFQYATARLKRKLYDNGIRKRSLDVRALRLEVSEDRFGNKDFELIDHGIVDVVIDLPGQSFQSFQGQRNSNNDFYNSGLSVYSFIPITAYPTNDSKLNNDDIIIFKYLLNSYDEEEQNPQLQIFKVASPIQKGSTTILYTEFTLAPYTFNMNEYPEIKTLIEQYKLEPVELWS